VRIVLTVTLAVGSFAAMRHLTGMDRWFFQWSLPGVKGLALYLTGHHDAAAQAYRAHWRWAISNGFTTRDQGTDLLLSGNLEGAERYARDQLSRDPKDLDARLLRAELALDRGAPKDAHRLATEVLAIAPSSPDAQVMIALAQARASEPDQAIDSLNRVLRTGTVGGRLATFYQLLETTGTLARDQTSPRPFCLLAHVHRYLRIFDRSEARPAARYARQAIAAGDRPADAYLTLGILAEKTGHLDEALTAFLAAIDANPHHAEAHRWAAMVYGQRGDLVNEYRMITTAFVESGDPYYATHLFEVLVEKVGEPQRAIALLSPLLAKNPNDAVLWTQVGQAHALMGHAPEALAHYQRATALAPRTVWIEVNMGWSLYRLGRLEDAIAAYQRAAALTPWLFEPHKRLMDLYYEDRRYRAAITEAETAIRLGDPDTYTHARLCNLYHNVADLERGESCCVSLLARDPGNFIALALLPKFRQEASLR
jgi:tetratricopeptide (TPR) repeat protein